MSHDGSPVSSSFGTGSPNLQCLYEFERVDDQVEHDRVGRAFLYAEFAADAGQGKRGLGLADPHRKNRLAVRRLAKNAIIDPVKHRVLETHFCREFPLGRRSV